jgi:hypothetical protein
MKLPATFTRFGVAYFVQALGLKSWVQIETRDQTTENILDKLWTAKGGLSSNLGVLGRDKILWPKYDL